MQRDVTVTVADSHLGALEGVAQRLALAGLEVDRVLTALGVITGSIEDSHRAALAAVDGVASVEEQRSFQLPPPDADVQ